MTNILYTVIAVMLTIMVAQLYYLGYLLRGHHPAWVETLRYRRKVVRVVEVRGCMGQDRPFLKVGEILRVVDAPVKGSDRNVLMVEVDFPNQGVERHPLRELRWQDDHFVREL